MHANEYEQMFRSLVSYPLHVFLKDMALRNICAMFVFGEGTVSVPEACFDTHDSGKPNVNQYLLGIHAELSVNLLNHPL